MGAGAGVPLGLSRGKRGKTEAQVMDNRMTACALHQKAIQTGSPDNLPTPLRSGKWEGAESEEREDPWASQPVIIQFFLH